MATIWSLVTATFVVLVATTVVPAASQEVAEMAQEGVPNQMEPLSKLHFQIIQRIEHLKNKAKN